MIEKFNAAVMARLSRWRVVDDRTKIDDRTFPVPWIVVDFPPPRLQSDRWEGTGLARAAGRFQTSAVGETKQQAGRVHDAVAALLVDWVPPVDGWTMYPVDMYTDPREMSATEIPDRRLVQIVTTWTWTAERSL